MVKTDRTHAAFEWHQRKRWGSNFAILKTRGTCHRDTYVSLLRRRIQCLRISRLFMVQMSSLYYERSVGDHLWRYGLLETDGIQSHRGIGRWMGFWSPTWYSVGGIFERSSSGWGLESPLCFSWCKKRVDAARLYQKAVETKGEKVHYIAVTSEYPLENKYRTYFVEINKVSRFERLKTFLNFTDRPRSTFLLLADCLIPSYDTKVQENWRFACVLPL